LIAVKNTLVAEIVYASIFACGKSEKEIDTYIEFRLYLHKVYMSPRHNSYLWGCNGLDGDRWYVDSEPRRLISLKLATSLNIKANEDYALAA
jgi:hypothetical protein